MSVEKLTFAEPFFTVLFVEKEEKISVDQKEIEGALEMSQIDPKAKDTNSDEIENKKRLLF